MPSVRICTQCKVTSLATYGKLACADTLLARLGHGLWLLGRVCPSLATPLAERKREREKNKR